MTFYVNYCLGTAAFWLVQASGVRQVYQALYGVFSGMLIPLVFFPKQMQVLLFFLPFQYSSYVPAMVWSGGYTLAGVTMSIPEIVACQGAAVILTALFSEFLYRRAIKSFTAAGG
jgi:ABC-2 type transport system permease protein